MYKEEFEDIIDMAYSLEVDDENHIKYILATVEHETAGTFEPTVEAFWVRDKLVRRYGSKRGIERFEAWGKRNFRTTKTKISYYPFYGRGYVQLTFRSNYKKFSRICSEHFGYEIDLVKYPSLACSKEIASFILVYGMKHGSFTGKKLSDYISDDSVDFVGARRIINGRDRARLVASIADSIEL